MRAHHDSRAGSTELEAQLAESEGRMAQLQGERDSVASERDSIISERAAAARSDAEQQASHERASSDTDEQLAILDARVDEAELEAGAHPEGPARGRAG